MKVQRGYLEDPLWAKIDGLNLDPIKVKLMHPEEGHNWSLEQVNALEKQYKRMLYLMVTTDVPIVPTRDLDEFWHQHILDTRKYSEDCQNTFGFFLHHFPYLGIRGGDDAQNLQKAFNETIRIYEEHFGEPYKMALDSAECSTCGGSSCSSSSCGSECGGFTSDRSAAQAIIRPDLRPTLALR